MFSLGIDMDHVLLLAAQQGENSGIPLPVMTIIALLLLMLPYLIRRYTGRSVTEWLRPSVIFGAFERGADRVRSALFGNKAGLLGKKLGLDPEKVGEAKAGPDGLTDKERADQEAAAVRAEEKARSARKQRAGSVQNDYLQTISRILTFARKNALFAIIPGNLAYQGKTADLTAILVTRSRVVGIMAYSFDGRILCRRDEENWQVQEPDGTQRQVASPVAETRAQDELARGALRSHDMGEPAYETAMLFTSSNAVLTGDRPAGCYSCEELFEALSGEDDLHGNTLDPKAVGKKIAALRAGKQK